MIPNPEPAAFRRQLALGTISSRFVDFVSLSFAYTLASEATRQRSPTAHGHCLGPSNPQQACPLSSLAASYPTHLNLTARNALALQLRLRPATRRSRCPGT
eukprot:2928393-Rhodomonas_salina.1